MSPSTEVLARLASIGKLDYRDLLLQKTLEQQSERASVRAMAVPLPNQIARSSPPKPRRSDKKEENMNREMLSMLKQVLDGQKSQAARIEAIESTLMPKRLSKKG